MAYVGIIKVGIGETIQDAIKLYMELSSQNHTNSETKIELNDINYPIGLFKEDSIDLFIAGVTTVNNLHILLDKGETKESERFKKTANYYAETLIERFKDDPYRIKEILTEFNNIMSKQTEKQIPMFDEEQRKTISEQLQQLTNNDNMKK